MVKHAHDSQSVFGQHVPNHVDFTWSCAKRVWTCMIQLYLNSHMLFVHVYTQLAICRQVQKDNKEKNGRSGAGKKPSSKARKPKGKAPGSKKDQNLKKPKKAPKNKRKTPKGNTTGPPASPAKTPEQPEKKRPRSKRHEN